MTHALDYFSDLKKTQITWVGGNGIRCLADLCYRTRELRDGISEVVCVVTERADNPGMSITNAAEQVLEAIISRFPAGDTIHVTERYDSRSYPNGVLDEALPRYALWSRPSGKGSIRSIPAPAQIAELYSTYWDDRTE